MAENPKTEIQKQEPQGALESMAGIHAIASMPEADFKVQLKTLKTALKRLDQIVVNLFEKDIDYGRMPGVNKDILYQEGAIQICRAFQLVPNYERKLIIGDGKTQPHIIYETTCYLHLGSQDGPIVGEGAGTCNSWESKYRYRWSTRTCPEMVDDGEGGQKRCGNEVREDKKKNGFYCWRKTGGCGVNFQANDKRITSQKLGKVDNPNPWDQKETFLQMSDKRALVKATRTTTGAGRRFTQDEDVMASAIQASGAAIVEAEYEQVPSGQSVSQAAETAEAATTPPPSAKQKQQQEAEPFVPPKAAIEYIDKLYMNPNVTGEGEDRDKLISEMSAWFRTNLARIAWYRGIKRLQERIKNNGGAFPPAPQEVASLGIDALNEE